MNRNFQNEVQLIERVWEGVEVQVSYNKMTPRGARVAGGKSDRTMSEELDSDVAEGRRVLRCTAEECESNVRELGRDEVIGSYKEGFYHKGNFGHKVLVERVYEAEGTPVQLGRGHG